MLTTTFALALPPAADSYGLTTGRFWATLAALLGLAGAIIGGRALARSATRTGRRGAVLALAAGLVSVVIGGVVVAAADGGPGKGYGVVGGWVALAAGGIATVLAGLALSRARRTV
ncbi:DUF6223 family protein [Actinophytocola sp.]|uniref:DUF6223 family protein n=1 Tax=Actinophytocola sp. TaxID=1872138 RepID=UPI002D7E7AA4|nr:DUF6223 family protein [Actinophytocola sp.]HET9138337.1 DUF6223 family protein [Actinophytocola sp.]HEU5110955.1 DUF6223 family protein [Micromonosporaceae bacterium]